MRRFLPVLLSVSVVAGCGFSPDTEPRPVVVESVPVDRPQPDTTSPGTVVRMWFVDGQELVPLEVTVPDVAPLEVIQVLVEGGHASGSSLRSAIPPDTGVLGAVIERGVATVDLSSEFTLVGGDEEILAVGQLVLTLTSLDGVTGVRLLVDGTPTPAPVGEGELVDRPLTASDFAGPVGG